jgi:large subunit ribosomal protein L25
MEAISISSERRDGTGKGPNRQLRMAGRVPAVVYGHGLGEPVNVSVDPKELLKVFNDPKGLNAVIDLQIEGGARMVMIREVQRHPLTRKLVHIDFVAPDPTKEVEADVTLTITGSSPGVQAGGKLRTPARTVRVRSLPQNIPASVTGDISTLEMGDNLMVSQLPMPEGVKPVFERDYVVAKVVAPRGGEKAGEKAEG